MNKSWLDRLEAKYGQYALNGLIYYIAGFMILIYILNESRILKYEHLFLIAPYVINNNEYWRLITFLFIPISQSPFFLFFELMIIIMCANGIEAAFGPFKMTLYYILGAIFMIIATLISPAIQLDSYLMYLSLFFGYATLYPDEELLFMFIIPIKIKYLAILSAIGLILNILAAPWTSKIALLLSFTNYLIFFGVPALKGIKYERKNRARRKAFEEDCTPSKEYIHKCSVCGKTDKSNPEILFKYCVCKKCGENGVCFCEEHLKEHKEMRIEN